MAELSLMRFHLHNFFNILMNSNFNYPMYTKLCRIAEAMAYSQPPQEQEHKDDCLRRIYVIHNQTHPDLNMQLSVVESLVIKNSQFGLTKELQMHGKTIKLYHLYTYLDEATKELTKIVMEIASKYGLEIPINTSSFGSKSF